MIWKVKSKMVQSKCEVRISCYTFFLLETYELIKKHEIISPWFCPFPVTGRENFKKAIAI